MLKYAKGVLPEDLIRSKDTLRDADQITQTLAVPTLGQEVGEGLSTKTHLNFLAKT